MTYISKITKKSSVAQEWLGLQGIKRRSLLKYVVLGSGFLVLGKIFGPSINFFGDTDFSKVTNFENFRVVESDKELKFFDKIGNEILTLDKES